MGSISYGLNIIYCFLNIKNPKYINSYDIQPNNTNDVIVLRGDYDFILHKKLLKEESEEIQEIVVFEPNQIKLADGTNTTFDSANDDIRFYDGGIIEDLINKGIVELKFYETTPEHAREYGIISKKPIYLQTIFVSENSRLKGVGKQVLDYLENYAKNNGNDLIFGHINNKAQFTKDDRETFFSDVDMIRYWLHNNGYAINEDNNDFHKLIIPNEKIRFAKGGITESYVPDYLRMFLDN
jgi:GNAT superfamily N-acetyltransferase